jgi:hypothetical protein
MLTSDKRLAATMDPACPADPTAEGVSREREVPRGVTARAFSGTAS